MISPNGMQKRKTWYICSECKTRSIGKTMNGVCIKCGGKLIAYEDKGSPVEVITK